MPKIENVIKFIFLVFVYTFPLGELVGINSLAIISLAVIALFDLIPSIKQADRTKLSLLLIPSLIFIGYAISGLLSHNVEEGLFGLQVKLSLIVMPIIFISNRIHSSIEREFIYKHFILILTLAVVYCIGFNFVVRYWSITNSYVTYMPWKDFSPTFANPILTQSIYLGYFCSFALLLIINQLFKSKESKTFYLITGAILLLGIVLNGAKMATIGFLLLGTFQYILLTSKRIRMFGLAGIAALTCIIGIFASQNGYLKARFIELAPSNWKIPMRGEPQNSVNLRFAIFSCSSKLLHEHWLTGIPVGDLQDQLNSCYLSNNYHEELSKFSFDTHNQYINTWLCLGITGLLVLLTMIFSATIYAIRNKDIIMLSFMILIFLSFIPENMLSTQKGVVFFSFFYCLFITIGIKKETELKNL